MDLGARLGTECMYKTKIHRQQSGEQTEPKATVLRYRLGRFFFSVEKE